MSEPLVFDSMDLSYKTPFGAVACGGEVSLRVRPLSAEGFSRCLLVMHREFAGSAEELELPCQGQAEERSEFSCTFRAPQTPELVWYHFRLTRPDGTGCLLDRSGYRSEGEPLAWQLTVYSDARKTPGWFGQGVTYQIFPDRYCRLSVPDPAGLVGDRLVHQAWDDLPIWWPDPDGEVRNRDFFGGSLAGIASKLDELEALGVTTLYLCPVFESASNHRYNTADYTRIDPMLGSEADFRALCTQARQRGIRVILDGVFNHTGSQSVYFNADGFYPTLGAAQSQDSPYYSWYRFSQWPTTYDAWWGIRTLPAVEEAAPDYQNFIYGSADSVVRRWLRCGASGWRLDVADELPDFFIAKIRDAVEETDPDAILIGEVWEDGSNKIAYSQRRRYLLGDETHALMNYPFRTAALQWLQGGDANDFRLAMETIREHYPPAAFFSAMNFLGTHDTPRILTLLAAAQTPESKDDRAVYQLSREEYAKGAALVQVAAALLFAFPGSPTIYYGDEAGMQGFEDPFNRRSYPWGREDAALKAWYTRLGLLRRGLPALQRGSIEYLYAAGPGLAFSRAWEDSLALAALNAGAEPLSLALPWTGDLARDAMTGQDFCPLEGRLELTLPPRSAMLLIPASQDCFT